jgi:hypothetical protein
VSPTEDVDASTAAVAPQPNPPLAADRPLLGVLAELEGAGYRGQARALDDGGDGALECLSCRATIAPGDLQVDHVRRLEGASDPADMLMVLAFRCPSCEAGATLVANYGPEATPGDAALLRSISSFTRERGPAGSDRGGT